jgi:hypothetical protein
VWEEIVLVQEQLMSIYHATEDWKKLGESFQELAKMHFKMGNHQLGADTYERAAAHYRTVDGEDSRDAAKLQQKAKELYYKGRAKKTVKEEL